MQQNKAMRIISGSKYNSSSAPLYTNLNILPHKDLHKLHLGKLMYLHCNYELPQPLQTKFVTNKNIHSHNTRTRHHPHVTSRNTSIINKSFIHQAPVIDLIYEALPWTLLLVGVSSLVSTFIGVLLGAYVAWKWNTKLDVTFVTTSLLVNSIPSFFTGMLFLAIFGYMARTQGWPIWFPTHGAITPNIGEYGDPILVAIDIIWHMFLPFTVMVIYDILGWGWFMRGNTIDVLTEDYIQTALAKGLDEKKVVFKHGMRNALLPVVTNIGMNFGGIIGGAVVIETVFSYPGMGLLLFQALIGHDYPLIQAGFIIIAGVTLLGMLIAEILYVFIDPRVREA